MNNEDIKALADLSRLHLSDADIENYKKDFNGILDYINTLQQVEITIPSDVESEKTHVNILREDGNAYTSGEYSEVLISAAPDQDGDFIKVNKVL